LAVCAAKAARTFAGVKLQRQGIFSECRSELSRGGSLYGEGEIYSRLLRRYKAKLSGKWATIIANAEEL